MKSLQNIAKPAGIALAFLATAFPTVSSAGPGDGSGVRGGGTVIDVNSTPHLMDLVTKTACTFKSGADLVEENAELEQVIALVSNLDWYFGLEIRRELGFLAFCFTGPLYRIADAPADGGVIPQPVETNLRQAAYRLNGKVFVDTAIYRAMDDHNRAFLVLHEMLHSYLPMDLLDRKIMLRSLVKALERVQKGEIRTRKAFHFQLKSAGVDFPRNVDLLDRYESQIRFFLGDRESQIAAIRGESNPERFLDVDFEFLGENLAKWDAETLAKISARKAFEDALTQSIAESDAAQFTALLAKPFKTIDVIAFAFALLPEIEKENQDALFTSSAFRNFLANGFSTFERASLTAGTHRIMANAAFVQLTREGSAPTGPLPLTDLHGATIAPKEVAWLTNSVVYLMRNGRSDQVAAHVTENPAFYSALGLKAAKRALDAMNPPILREKPLAIEVLTGIRESLVRSFLDSVAARLTSSEYAAFESTIHMDRF